MALYDFLSFVALRNIYSITTPPPGYILPFILTSSLGTLVDVSSVSVDFNIILLSIEL